MALRQRHIARRVERLHHLEYGRATRTVPATLRRVVTRRDRHCRYPGCDRPPHWCEVHHHLPWELGGPTNLVNLVNC